jgi:hypothetical protein
MHSHVRLAMCEQIPGNVNAEDIAEQLDHDMYGRAHRARVGDYQGDGAFAGGFAGARSSRSLPPESSWSGHAEMAEEIREARE